jgi:hypothetical protein
LVPVKVRKFASEFEAGLKLEEQATAKTNAGISPLRRAMRLRDFGRDDDFFLGF